MASVVSTVLPPRVSVLGLPLELRRKIYQETLLLDLQWMAMDHWDDIFLPRLSFRCTPAFGSNPSIPWVNLSSTCKTIRGDIHNMMGDASTLRNSENTTYVLDLNFDRDCRVTWQSLPCSPAAATRLIANVSFCQDFRVAFWGDGGPRAIVRQIYQTLNRTIHCGPRLDDRKPLEQAMHFDEVCVRIDGYREGDPRDPKDELRPNAPRSRWFRVRENTTSRPFVYKYMSRFINDIVTNGIAFGYVDSFTLVDEEEHDAMATWTVEQIENGGIPEEWRGYGFQWGVHPIDAEEARTRSWRE